MHIIKATTNIDFLSATRRKIAIGISLFMICVSLLSLARQGLELGIDFTGGILLEVGYSQSADLEAIRGNLSSHGFNDAQVQLFGADTSTDAEMARSWH